NARSSRDTSGLEPIRGAGQDDGFFELSEITMNVGKKMIEVQDRVAYDLSRSVERDVSTPVDPVKRCTPRSQGVLGKEQVTIIATFAEGKNGWMLYEQQDVGHLFSRFFSFGL